MAIVGVEWLVEAEECSAAALRDAARVRLVLERVIRDLDLKVIGHGAFHTFSGPDGSSAGVTAFYLLRESHLCCHTYPEHGVATFNLYCCKAREEWPWTSELREALGSKRVFIQKRFRGEGG